MEKTSEKWYENKDGRTYSGGKTARNT